MLCRRTRAGTTAIEYALIGSLIGAFLIVALSRFASVANLLHTVVETLVSAALS